jgi:hypothetical protein
MNGCDECPQMIGMLGAMRLERITTARIERRLAQVERELAEARLNSATEKLRMRHWESQTGEMYIKPWHSLDIDGRPVK